MSEIVNAEMVAAWDGAQGDEWVEREERMNETLPRPHGAPARRRRGHRHRSGARRRVWVRRVHPGLRDRRRQRSRPRRRPVDCDARPCAAAGRGGGHRERRVRPGRRAGVSVRTRRLRSGRQPVRRDVLRRSRGRVRQHCERREARRTARAHGMAGDGPQRMDHRVAHRARRRAHVAGASARSAGSLRARRSPTGPAASSNAAGFREVDVRRRRGTVLRSGPTPTTRSTSPGGWARSADCSTASTPTPPHVRSTSCVRRWMRTPRTTASCSIPGSGWSPRSVRLPRWIRRACASRTRSTTR